MRRMTTLRTESSTASNGQTSRSCARAQPPTTTCSPAHRPRRHRCIRESVKRERSTFVIALPTRVGPSLAGVATDATGFVEVDEAFKVRGGERLWAAGSCIAAALEHSALSALQADAAAAAIAHAAGLKAVEDVDPVPDPLEVTGILLTGQRDRWLAENPVGTREPSTHCLWWPSGRAVGHMLARQIASWESVCPSAPSRAPGRSPDTGARGTGPGHHIASNRWRRCSTTRSATHDDATLRIGS